MNAPAPWILGIIYWLHMLATITWVGSLAAINLLVLPASRQSLQPADQLSLISALQKKLEPLAWFSMGLLWVTGLFQLSTSPHYDGFLNISTQWTAAILLKHILALGMVVTSAIQTWEVLPSIQRELLRKEIAKEEELAKLQKQEIILLRVNLFFSVLILGATAFARVS